MILMTQEEFYKAFGETWGSGGIEYTVTFANPHIAWMVYESDPCKFMETYGDYARRS